MTWGEYLTHVQNLASWLHSKGVGPGDKVAILSGNRPEWIISDLAIMWLGAITVPIYATTTEKDISYIAQHSEAKMFMVDNVQRARVLAGVPLGAVVIFDLSSADQTPFLSCQSFSYQQTQDFRGNILKTPHLCKEEDIATLIYTSGTTGQPKGVVHTHANMSGARDVVEQVLLDGKKGPDRFFSFLPLCHVAERMLVEVGSIVTGSEVAFARSVSSLGDDLVRCRPTVLLCVPRLWEKMYEKININLSHSSALKRAIFNVAKWLGSARIVNDRALRRRDRLLRVVLSDALAGKAFRKKLGLDRARILATGSAPTREDVMRFFASFGLFVREVYGLTENLCLGVYNVTDIRFNTCGKVFQGNQIKIAEDQEILFKAPWLFKGYYKDPVATREAFTGDGWFCTGDLGSLDSESYLRIVGRKKELLKTSTGKYVAPVPIEDKLKALPLIQDAMVVGDNQKYCVALVCLDEKACSGSYQSDLVEHLNQVNRDLANHESIKRIGILDHSFSVEEGTLTPTLKLKRKVAFEKNEPFINHVYEAAEVLVFQASQKG